MDTKSAILDAAQELVQTVGSNAMSYGDISRVVGIRKASIHYYFPKKTELLSALVQRYTDSFIARVDEIAESQEVGLLKLQRFVGLFENVRQDSDCSAVCLCGMLAAEVSTLSPKVRRLVRRFYVESAKRLTAILRDGKKDGTLHLQDDPPRLAMFVLSLMEGNLILARVARGERDFGAATKTLFHLVESRSKRRLP